MLPVPEQDPQVLAIWKPLSSTKVRAPDPPQAVHVERFAPGLSPEPEQDEQLTTGVTLIVREVPLHASMNEMPTEASMSLPRMFCRADRPPPPNAPNSDSNRSDCPPEPRPPKSEERSSKPWNDAPAPPNPCANAFGSKPGCCEADPNWSYAARFFSSFNVCVHEVSSVSVCVTVGGMGPALRRMLPGSLRTFLSRFCPDWCLGGVCVQATHRVSKVLSQTTEILDIPQSMPS